jgi:hypothetical protein
MTGHGRLLPEKNPEMAADAITGKPPIQRIRKYTTS